MHWKHTTCTQYTCLYVLSIHNMLCPEESDHCTALARLNGWPINTTLQLFAILIICNYLTDRAVQNTKRDIFGGWVYARIANSNGYGYVNACMSATMHTNLCLQGEREKTRLIVSYPILCVAFSMIRYILYTFTSLTHSLCHSHSSFLCTYVLFIPLPTQI